MGDPGKPRELLLKESLKAYMRELEAKEDKKEIL